MRIFFYGHEEVSGNPLHRCEYEDSLKEPVVVGVGVMLSLLE